jgi:NAD(P)-dependent dehydrogenase (short-subunit alcohol dehydrogenase family)
MTTLKDKVAVVFAASGAIASEAAKSFAGYGAKVYVSGKDIKTIEVLCENIIKKGGWAEAKQVDALNEVEIDNYLKEIVTQNSRLDIVLNGIGIRPSENSYGIPATEISFEHFMKPIQVHCGSQFLTSRISAKYMIATKSKGTILMLTSSLSRLKFPNMSGITAACAAIEGLTRVLAAEFAQHGIKVVCLNSAGLYETRTMEETFSANAKTLEIAKEELITRSMQMYLLKTGPTLKQIGEVAAFLVSEHGVTFNSHIVDVDCGRFNVI